MFSNVLFVLFSIYKEYHIQIDITPPLTCGNFELELEILYARMGFEVITMLELFLSFVTCFNVIATHYVCTPI